MALYTKKEFADLNLIQTKDLSNYISRGKVVLKGELIDVEDKTNQYFIEKRKEFNLKKGKIKPVEAIADVAEEKLNKRSAEKKTTPPASEFTFPTEPPVSENYKLDSQIKKQSIEKSSLETSLLKAKLDKLSGESIPTQLVKNLIAHHSKSITVAFRHGADNFLMKIAKKVGIDRIEISELRVELVDIINSAVNDSIEESKRGLQNIISEYSQKKGVGERE